MEKHFFSLNFEFPFPVTLLSRTPSNKIVPLDVSALSAVSVQQLSSIPSDGRHTKFVEEIIKANKVVVFSKTTCPFCHRVKHLFDQEGIEVRILDIYSSIFRRVCN